MARYGYDVLGRRIARRVYWSPLPGAEARETRYIYQGGQVVAETDAAGAFKWKYTWGPGTDNLVGLQDSTGTQFYVVQDQLGSVRGLVRRDGTWIMSQRFTPYGQLLVRDSAVVAMPKGLHVGWTGRETDPETGLTFHRARYYSPELRRWTQEDPIGYGGGVNLYAYVGGAVLEGRDPSGLFAEVGDLGLGFAEQETFSGGGDLSMCLVFCTDARGREGQRWEAWFDSQTEITVTDADGSQETCPVPVEVIGVVVGEADPGRTCGSAHGAGRSSPLPGPRRLAAALQRTYIAPMSALRFTWDPRKAASNARKHGVTFEEAQTAFTDEHGLLLDDPEHSRVEERFILLGLSAALHLLVVVHCYRTPEDTIRLISARKATRVERRAYTDRWTQ